MKIQVSRVYNVIQSAFDAGYSTVSAQGSARSSKTYTIVIWLIVRCLSYANTTVAVVRGTRPALKGTVYRDFEEIMKRMGQWDQKCMNKTDLIYTFPNGSWIEFFPATDDQRLRGRKRMILYVNEANELTFDEWTQLKLRTTLFTLIDYNPSFDEEHWIVQKVNGSPRTKFFISTYKDNPFLEQSVIDSIEELRDTSPSLWQVYGLGMRAIIEGRIFKTYEVVDELPAAARRHRFLGLDFGYTCFRGDTLITTARGQVPIKDVVAGDYVLTRKGYCKVKKNMYNGKKVVIGQTLKTSLGTTTIFATFAHNFNANGKWKKYGELTAGDSLFVLSHLMGANTDDTQTANTQIITIASGSQKAFSTVKCFITSGSMQHPKTTSHAFANIAAKSSKETNTLNQKLAATSAHISCCGLKEVRKFSEQVCDVYDLEIEDVHEYFANGVLVHNCDPTAIVLVSIVGHTIYLDELCYRTQMSTDDIIEELKQQRWQPKVWADSSEPREIDEIYNAGIDIHGVKKYSGSVRAGLQKMQTFKLVVTRRSTNLIKELKSYVYRKDKNGKWLNEPVDAFNHCFAADTLVTTSMGCKRIADITSDHMVLTSSGYKRVTRKWNNGTRKIKRFTLVFDDGQIVVRATPDHLVKTSKKWQKIACLHAGDVVFTQTKGIEQTAREIKAIFAEDAGEAQVFDLEVAQQHEYFANGLLVHNCIDAIRYVVLEEVLGQNGDGLDAEELADIL